jgi:hypothetical protein
MNRLGLLALAIVLAGGIDGGRAAEMPKPSECLAGPVVQELLSAGTVRRLAEIRRGLVGDIVRADLCRWGPLLVYRVTLLDDLGKVRHVLLDASSGRMVYDGNGK